MENIVIGIIEKNGKLLMIKRKKTEGNLIWAFPGGKVEENETKEEACIREVYEETGITVTIKKILGERIHPDTKKTITYFLCEYKSGSTTILDKDEVSEISYKNKQELYRDIKTNIYPPILKFIEENIK